MTAAEVREELEMVRKLERAKNNAYEMADDFEKKLMSGKSVSYESNGESHEKKGNPVANAYDYLFKLREDAERFEHCYLTAYKRAQEIIKLAPNSKQQEVLKRCYLMGKRPEEIAKYMHYSADHVNHLKMWGLKACAENMTRNDKQKH